MDVRWAGLASVEKVFFPCEILDADGEREVSSQFPGGRRLVSPPIDPVHACDAGGRPCWYASDRDGTRRELAPSAVRELRSGPQESRAIERGDERPGRARPAVPDRPDQK